MEATGRDRVRGPSWSYRRHEQTGSPASAYTTSSSRSGTIVSTYTSGSSRRSSISMEADLLRLELQFDVEASGIETDKKDAEFVQPPIKKRWKETGGLTSKQKSIMKHIEKLVQEFFREPSEDCSILVGCVLVRWFSKLGVRWVLHHDGYASRLLLRDPTRIDEIRITWIRALAEIMETIRLTASLFPHHAHGFVGMPGISGKQAATSLDPVVQFAQFFQKAMSKMLVFVDVMFTKSLSVREPPYTSNSLISGLDVYGALSKALSSGIRLQFHSPPSTEVETIEKEMVSLLLAKQGKAFEAIWSTLEGVRNHVLNSMEEDSSGTQTPQGSSYIHEATYSVIDHFNFLLRNRSTVTLLVSQAASLGKYEPQAGLGEAPPFMSLIADIVSSLEEKLITKSQLFPDQGLRFLFLLNNLNFIWEKLKYHYMEDDVNFKVEHYIESYIQVSWEPLLACLFNPTPTWLRLVRKYSPLSKFESEFQKTYTTQKLWKIPDPENRKRLRKAVIQKIIPGYTKYIENSKVTDPKFTPQELEDMLQELFEG